MADHADARAIGLEHGREALRRFLVGEDDLDTMLGRIAVLATETVPGCDLASITMIRRGKPTTPVCTDKVAKEIDEVQYDTGGGPCLACIGHQGPEHVVIDADERWPAFNAASREAGVLATVSVPLGDEAGAHGALNLYSRTQPAFDADAQATACLFADQIGVAAAKASAYAEAFELARQLQEAMESRAVIEQAKGILMAAQRCSPDEAFDILRRASQNQNRKVRDIAAEVVNRHVRGKGA